jgi:putative DNA primase/helicase
MTAPPITPELIAQALAYIPASLARDEWARVAMAIKSEFDDSTGFDLFDAWSTTAEGYEKQATTSTWRSVKAGGGVGIGTLFRLAKEHGFERSRADRKAWAHRGGEPAQGGQERAHDRALREQQERARIASDQAEAASTAAQAWDGAAPLPEGSAQHPYLERKGVQAFGLRRGTDGSLLVPVRDVEGRLWNVQRIAPVKPAHGPDKLFFKGGRKSGCWHWLGAAPEAQADMPVILLAEGYATAASVHQATGHPVALAFDAGNLKHVAEALRLQHPLALLVVCGDDDLQTFALKGINPGRDKATAAAGAVQGLAVFPSVLPEGGSDFNDMHQHLGGMGGLEAVKHAIEGAISATLKAKPGAAQGRGAKTRAGRRLAEGDADLSMDRFLVNDDGVWHQGIDQEGNIKKPEWVCSRLDVQALTRNAEGNGWGYLLSFSDPLGRLQQWAMPSRMLSGDGGEYRSLLLDRGLRIAPSPRARNLLTQYIQTRQPEQHALCTDRVGWHGSSFVLPHETIGTDDAERIVFQSDSAMENTFRVKGTTAQWRERVAALCVGNSRLAFAVACAFAGPLLRPAGVESGGFHLRGDSSSGKTTALRVAASVYGAPSFMQRWRTTDNALEAIAAQHSDCLLILDELAQVDPKTAGECAYMLANEQSKARATRNGAPRARLTWRLLFLSAGELGLADHMAEGMKRTRTGQEVRMADIPADAGMGMGAFETLHSSPTGADLSRLVTAASGSYYGAVGLEWLQWLTTHADTLKTRTRKAAAALAGQWVPHGASGQVERVAARFALVAVAGELATEAGLTGWPEGESVRAIKVCFDAWLNARGGAGNGEVASMLRQVRRFLELHGEGRFTWWHRASDDHSAKTLHRAGFRRMVSEDGTPIKSDPDHQREYGERMSPTLGEAVRVEYFVMPETFKSEVCQGFDPQAVCRVLHSHGCLVAKEAERFSVKERLPGLGPSRCYRITPAIFELDC